MRKTAAHPLPLIFYYLLEKWKLIILTGAVFCLVFSMLSFQIIERSAEGKIFSGVDETPAYDIGLLLGASVKMRDGRTNYYMQYRIDAAAELFKAGKIKHILVSGDNHSRSYDEPTEIRKALVKKGIPNCCITLDYAGFSTFDSMVRCRKIFGQQKVIIISQEYHCRRAIYIARHCGIEATAFAARDLAPGKHYREYLARAAAMLDLFFLHSQPHFLGPQERILKNC